MCVCVGMHVEPIAPLLLPPKTSLGGSFLEEDRRNNNIVHTRGLPKVVDHIGHTQDVHCTEVTVLPGQ